MNIKIIACAVFQAELPLILTEDQRQSEIEYLPINAHNEPESLKQTLQEKIDLHDGKYDQLILVYGLCGNSVAGLQAGKTPLIVAKAHDCSQILLGREKHKQHLGENPSVSWITPGYMLSGEEEEIHGPNSHNMSYEMLEQQYGSENAAYLWEVYHPAGREENILAISAEETDTGEWKDWAKQKAAEYQKELVHLTGTLDILKNMVNSKLSAELLFVPPGYVIEPSWDDNVIKTVPQQENTSE